MAALMHFDAVASTGFVTDRGKAYRSIAQTEKFGVVVAVVIGADLISTGTHSSWSSRKICCWFSPIQER